MREIDKYGVLKEKLQGICEENSLTYSIQNQKHPFLMIIKPLGGIDAQQTMMEGMENPGETGYINPEASLVFAYKDGDLTYKISETWTISENLFNKLKNIFKKMHFLWMQYFFRDAFESHPGWVPAFDPTTVNQDAENCETEDEDTDEAFAEFMSEEEAQLYNDGGVEEDDEE
jgi:hypothetical protein